jgi:hypothetical protein
MRARSLLLSLIAPFLSYACGGSAEPSAEVQARLAAATARARVVAVDPAQGAQGLAPGPITLSVTFDRPMDTNGWAWVVEDETTSPEIGEAVRWSADGRTCSVEAFLGPDRQFVVWINSERFDYFKDPAGTPAEPFRWSFGTTGSGRGTVAPPVAADTPAGRAARLLPLPAEAPRVLALEPADGARDVPVGTTELRVTFDRPMAEGWSWVTEAGSPFPESAGRAYFTPDMRVNVLPVRLAPGTSYVIWLNSGQFQDFADPQGRVLEPRRWSFTTGF